MFISTTNMQPAVGGYNFDPLRAASWFHHILGMSSCRGARSLIAAIPRNQADKWYNVTGDIAQLQTCIYHKKNIQEPQFPIAEVTIISSWDGAQRRRQFEEPGGFNAPHFRERRSQSKSKRVRNLLWSNCDCK